MVRFIHCALAWAGGRTGPELATTAPGRHSGAALIGLALAAASVLSLMGWRQWLLDDGGSTPAVLGLVMAAAAAALFRQLAHVSEAAAYTVQRLAIQVTAALLLVPGAYVAAKSVPALLFQSRVGAHQQVLAVQTQSVAKATLRRPGRTQLPDVVDRSTLDAMRHASCLPLIHCHLQRAVISGSVSGLEAWGATLAVLFLGLLPALLLIVLPLDGCARERQFRAIEDTVLCTALSDGTRKALTGRAACGTR